MAERRSKRLAQMQANPAADWRIEDVMALCREHGIRCSPPTGGGSHYKISHAASRDILTIQAADRQSRFTFASWSA